MTNNATRPAPVHMDPQLYCDWDLIPMYWRRKRVHGVEMVGRVCNTAVAPGETCPNTSRHWSV